MEQLNRELLGKQEQLPLKVMQFGGGNFLRAFADWVIQILNEETAFAAGVAIVKPTAGGGYDDLRAQDGLFNVILDGFSGGEFKREVRLVECVQKIVNPYSEWEDYLALAEKPGLRFIISNTTEAGIRFNPEDRSEDQPPIEFPAKLTLWLYHRFKHFDGDKSSGCILLPCELIEKNGETLKETVLQYADQWQLGDNFSEWIKQSNYFCNTLVDRIVSGYPAAEQDQLYNQLRYRDNLLVAGEQYHSWLIQAPQLVQSEFPVARTGLNVRFVEDLVPYREMKVRILNGAHTAMVPVAYLAGIRLVKEAMEQEAIAQYITSLLTEEISPTLGLPDEEKREFINDVLLRFRNPSIRHQLISISLNSTSKFVTRLLPSLENYYNSRGVLPKRILLALAALLRFYKGNYKGESIPLQDNSEILEFFNRSWAQAGPDLENLERAVEDMLSNVRIWGSDLRGMDGIVEGVTSLIRTIEGKGMYGALKTCLETPERFDKR